MAKPRICPHCQVEIPPDGGFRFDDKLNLICGECGKIAFPTSEDTEQSVFARRQGGWDHKPPQPYNPHHKLSRYGIDAFDAPCEDIPEG